MDGVVRKHRIICDVEDNYWSERSSCAAQHAVPGYLG